ncbi:MAG TPA: arylamine N-acetyltransferase [Dongiaceae bacterium]|nr:arylamine N-acetyltransferase [Dongiaceae bacterium]
MTSDRAFDLSAYLARIGYDGPRTPTLETLRAIQLLHPQAIAFENLNPLLAIPVRLDLEFLQEKLIRSPRGGYCFEQNGVLLHALRALQFRVTGLAARVVWNQPDPSVTTPRSHMVLKVDLDEGTYIADVGFGMSPTAPLRLVPDIAQETPHESFRLLDKDGLYTLQCDLKGHWTSFYLFDLQEQAPIDYQVANHYVSTWPTSHFVTSLIAARATADGRYGLRNNKLSIHQRSVEREQRVLTSAAEISTVLKDLFGVVVPDESAFAARLARLDWPDFSAS